MGMVSSDWHGTFHTNLRIGGISAQAKTAFPLRVEWDGCGAASSLSGYHSSPPAILPSIGFFNR